MTSQATLFDLQPFTVERTEETRWNADDFIKWIDEATTEKNTIALFAMHMDICQNLDRFPEADQDRVWVKIQEAISS